MKPKFTDSHKYPQPYVGAKDTDISVRFKRILKAQKEAKDRQRKADLEAEQKMVPIRRVKP